LRRTDVNRAAIRRLLAAAPPVDDDAIAASSTMPSWALSSISRGGAVPPNDGKVGSRSCPWVQRFAADLELPLGR
jgi:hypothetical protein